MNKFTYRLMISIVLIALTFGSYSNMGVSSVLAAATTYYVSTIGNDSNAGTSSAPFKTIQKCLDWVKPGETCQVAPGTYKESLKLKTSGTASLPITLKCESSKACTVNSGSLTTVASSNRTHYYTIDGFRFIGTSVTTYATLYFGEGATWSESDKTLGNNGFIVRNCYVEGNLKFYGHDNLVENCEFNGKSLWQNGVADWYAASYNNTYRNNLIYDYTGRGIWSMDRTDNILVEGNTIRNSGKCIDADGAGFPVTHHTIRNNIFTNCSMGVELENTFDSLVEWNTFTGGGIGIHVSGSGNGPDFFTTNKIEYRDKDINTVIRNNIINNPSQTAITSTGQTGGTFVNNTIYYPSNSAGYYSGVDLSLYGSINAWASNNWTVKNNIVFNQNAVLIAAQTTGSKIDNNFYTSNARFVIKDKSTGTSVHTFKTFAQWQAMGYDINSKLGNPLFANAAAGDFHLQTNSPACGAGAFSCGNAVSTVIPTSTPTATASPFPTATKTSIPTATASPFPTATKTSIPTVTASPFPTATKTSIPTATISPVLTATSVVILEPEVSPMVSSGMKSVDIRVTKGENDVEESSRGKVYTNSANLQLVYDTSIQKVGIRFTDVNIPQGAIIVNAYIQFKASKTSTVGTSLFIQGDASANASAFTNSPKNVSSRPRTAGTVKWSPSAWKNAGAVSADQLTPNLAPIIQEIVSNSGWAPGNSVAFIITGNGKRVAKAYEGDAAGAPLLHIEYTTNTNATTLSLPVLLEMTAVVPTEFPTTLPATQVPVATATILPSTEVPVFTATALPPTAAPVPTATVTIEVPSPVIPITSSSSGGQGPVLPVFTPTAESINIVNQQPVITSGGELSIAENTAVVTTITATDADLPAETLTYSISGGADAALFNINSSTGELTFITAPDFELPADAGVDNIYNVTVQVSDGTLAATQDVVVTITGINDNIPVITSGGEITIAENTAVVTTITATDADLPAETLTYSISGGADAALLSVNSSTGELTFITAPDFELPADAGVDNIYNVTVQVSDGTLAATQNVVVTITGINDNIPVITSGGEITIAENTAAVTTVTATDADLPAETLTYSISGGADAALLSVNSSTGELTFITAPDFELPADAGVDNIYNVTVQVSDGTLTAVQDVVVTITGINDNTPVITSGGELSIAENTAAVTTVTATDADLPAETLTYSISGGADAALLSVNSSTGELTFITAPDFELPADAGVDNIYNVTVQVSDGTLTATQDVVVSVLEINDNIPVITSNGTPLIAENTTVVTTITSTDADLPIQTLNYSISGGADAASFNINSSTGELTFITAPDFELPADAGGDNIYNVTVQASDGTLTSAQDVVVTITAIDDNNPVVTSSGSFLIFENITAVTTVTATDADLPVQTLTYSVSGGTDAALFSINSSTGELTFITAPDFELPTDVGIDNVYNVTVQVSGGTLIAMQEIVITVKGIDQP